MVLDGCSDGSFSVLQRAFELVEVPCVLAEKIPTRVPQTAKFVAAGTAPLVVFTKENSGRADSINLGINAARYPLVCMVDADSILDPEALLRVAQPFMDDPERVIATGGVIRAANGCLIRHGRIMEVRMPRPWLARIQVMEYLPAPRGALTYPLHSGEGLEVTSLGPMAYLASKEKGNNSMPLTGFRA